MNIKSLLYRYSYKRKKRRRNRMVGYLNGSNLSVGITPNLCKIFIIKEVFILTFHNTMFSDISFLFSFKRRQIKCHKTKNYTKTNNTRWA